MNGEIMIDQGFNVKKVIGRAKINRSQLVTTRAKMSFTYKAYVEEVIDGDTLWALVDLGLGNYISQKLRLRAIDCPELKTPAGKRAKKFVQKALQMSSIKNPASRIKKIGPIIICSSKSDKYDRYLADIYYGKDEIFLNQQLLDEGFARVWVDS